MPKQIVGNALHWIENGRQTNRLVDVQEAFGDPAQARDQVLFAEAPGDREQIRLVRLAYLWSVSGNAISGREQGQAKEGSQGGSEKGTKDGKVLESESGEEGPQRRLPKGSELMRSLSIP